jgi:hypothetical protein
MFEFRHATFAVRFLHEGVAWINEAIRLINLANTLFAD